MDVKQQQSPPSGTRFWMTEFWHPKLIP